MPRGLFKTETRRAVLLIVVAVTLSAMLPALAQGQGSTMPQVRLPEKLDQDLRKHFLQDEELLIDELRKSLDAIEGQERGETLDLTPDGDVIIIHKSGQIVTMQSGHE